MTRIIAVANQKGGVGKTTTAISLAAALAIMERRTLLIDCDPQANATSGLGFGADTLSRHLYSVLLNPEEAMQSVLPTQVPFLFLLPSCSNLAGAELELVNSDDREFVLKKVLQNIGNHFDYIILDCPPSLGLLTLNALCAAGEILVPLQSEFFALEGLVKLFRSYEQIRKRLNPTLALLGIVLTMYDARNRLSRQVQEEVKRCFPEHLFPVVIPRNIRLSEAPSHGKSILHYDIKSKGAEAYLQLAQEVVRRHPLR